MARYELEPASSGLLVPGYSSQRDDGAAGRFGLALYAPERAQSPQRREYKAVLVNKGTIAFPNTGDPLRDFYQTFPEEQPGFGALDLRDTVWWAGVEHPGGVRYPAEELAYRVEALRALSRELDRVEQESGLRGSRCRLRFAVEPVEPRPEEACWAEAHGSLRAELARMERDAGFRGHSPRMRLVAEEAGRGLVAVRVVEVDAVVGLMEDLGVTRFVEQHLAMLHGSSAFRGLAYRDPWIPPEARAYLREKARRNGMSDEERWVYEWLVDPPAKGSRPHVGFDGRLEQGHRPFGLL